MKYVFALLILLVSQNVFAEDHIPLDSESTPQGYKPNDFCKVNAKKRLNELDNITNNEVEKVKPIITDLNDLMAKRNTIKGFLKLRDDFLNSINTIKNQYSNDEMKNLGNFKKLLRSSLTLEAVKMAADEKPDSELTVEKLCVNSSKSFCKYLDSIHIKTFYSEEIDGINKTLKNYAEARGNEKDPTFTDDQIKALYETIPKTIRPSLILEVISDKPEISKVLGSNRSDIESCLKGTDANCFELMKSPVKRNELKALLGSQLSSLQKDFASREFDTILSSVDSTADKKHMAVADKFQEKMGDALKKLNEIKDSSNIGLNPNDVTNLTTTCKDSSSDAQMKCRKLSEDLVSFFDKSSAYLDIAINKKTEELQSFSSTEGALGRTLKMRQYVAEKYLRKCSNAKQSDVAMPTTICTLLGTAERAGDGNSVEGLKSNVWNVVSRLISNGHYSKQHGELGLFSKSELAVYENYCSNSTTGNSFMDICNDISKNYNAIKNQKESKDWEEFNNKYWVLPSDSNPKGYEVYEKKTNARIFGEGLSQSVSRIYPTWLGNMNLKNQIDMMENQAMYMKQLDYMYSPTSPWNNFAYFPGSYYTFPTSTNFSNPFSTSAGFNFTK